MSNNIFSYTWINLNFLETSGPLQACKGTDLPLFFTCFYGLTIHIEPPVLDIDYPV